MDQIINLLPLSERKKILENNIINDAVAVANDNNMQYLAIIWKTYIEPTVEISCNPCLSRIHKNFREMHGRMLELQNEANLLG